MYLLERGTRKSKLFLWIQCLCQGEPLWRTALVREVGPEVLPSPLRRCKEAAWTPNVPSCWFRWACRLPGPWASPVAPGEVFRPQSEGRDTVLALREAPLREEVWKERRGEASPLGAKDGSKKDVGLPAIALTHSQHRKKGRAQPSPAQPSLWVCGPRHCFLLDCPPGINSVILLQL